VMTTPIHQLIWLDMQLLKLLQLLLLLLLCNCEPLLTLLFLLFGCCCCNVICCCADGATRDAEGLSRCVLVYPTDGDRRIKQVRSDTWTAAN
jgi:hypothetical protein